MKLINSLAELNQELKLAEIDDEDIEKKIIEEINLLNDKYSTLIDKSLLGISKNKITFNFNKNDFYIDYDLLIDLDHRMEKKSFDNYCDFITENIENEKLMGDEYLVKLEIHNQCYEIDNLTLISFLYVLSSLNKEMGYFIFKPILRIRRNESNTKFTIFYFLNNDITSDEDFKTVCKFNTGADTTIFKTIEHFKYIVINGHKFYMDGCSISNRIESFNLLAH